MASSHVVFRHLSLHQSRKVRHNINNIWMRKRLASPTKRLKSTAILEDTPSFDAITPPTKEQLRLVFLNAAIPMLGFGFMDQTIMLQAGNAIDCTLGVAFGLSTLTAAAFGQVCSDASGVVFGGTLERLATSLGLPKSGLSAAQRTLSIVKRRRWAGNFVGVMTGCILGLVNLFFIDTSRSANLKLEAFNEESEFEFSIEASNADKHGVTALRVQGPDVDGLLASMTAALSVRDCSLVELHAKRKSIGSILNDDNADETKEESRIDDIFYVIKRSTGEAFDDDELDELARGLLEATRNPMNVNSIKAAMNELESKNSFLHARVQKLEKVVDEKQITIVPSNSSDESKFEREMMKA